MCAKTGLEHLRIDQYINKEETPLSQRAGSPATNSCTNDRCVSGNQGGRDSGRGVGERPGQGRGSAT